MLDTMKAADDLREAGFTDAQSRGIVAVLRELATANDVKSVEANVEKLDIKVEKLAKDIVDMKVENAASFTLLKWMAAAIFTLVLSIAIKVWWPT
jgi:hypothetical protein